MNTSDSAALNVSAPGTLTVREAGRLPSTRWGLAVRWGLVLIALAGAVGAGWYVWEARREEQIRKFVSEYRKRGGDVTLVPVPLISGLSVLDRLPFHFVNFKDGVEFVNLLFCHDRVSALSGAPLLNSDLGVISQIRNIDALTLPRTRLTPELIECVAGLPHLKKLTLPHSWATDETLTTLCHKLEGRPELSHLFLGRSQITENGMKELRLLRHLQGATVQSPLVKNSYKSFMATRKEISRVSLR